MKLFPSCCLTVSRVASPTLLLAASLSLAACNAQTADSDPTLDEGDPSTGDGDQAGDGDGDGAAASDAGTSGGDGDGLADAGEEPLERFDTSVLVLRDAESCRLSPDHRFLLVQVENTEIKVWKQL